MSRYKPYPEYKNSTVEWLPKLPVNWQTLRLGAIFQERGERGGEKSELLAVSQQYGVLPQAYLMEITERRLSASSSDDWSNYRRVCKGDIVYNKMRLWQGAIGLSEHDGIVSPAYVVLNPLTEVSGRFYEYLFKTSLFITEAGRYSQGLCDDMNSCRYEDFKSARIILPTLNEQHMIVTYLDREITPINDLINAKTRFIELLREKRQTLITHAVAKGLDPNVKMKDSGVEWLGQVPEHWNLKPFKVCISFQEGPGIMASDFRDSGIPLLRISGVQGQWATLDGCNYLDKTKVSKQWDHFRLCRGDLLISASASMGTVCEIGEEAEGAIAYTGLIRLRENSGVMLKSFIRWVVVSSIFSTQVDLLKTGATIQHFGPTHLNQMKVLCPPIGEQKAIASYLEGRTARIDALIYKTEHSIELLKERRSALITAAVTGQIDLREVGE